jgi:hypothetical protein
MNRKTPTLRSKELGTRLRAVLVATGKVQNAITSRLGKSPNYVSRTSRPSIIWMKSR